MWYEDDDGKWVHADDATQSSGDDQARIAYAALHSKWEHPRDFRVLVGLLRYYPKGLTRHIGLRSLSVEAGLSDDGKLTRSSLDRLQDAGWLTWSHSKFENRTTVELIPPLSTGTYRLWDLPDQTSDAFNHPHHPEYPGIGSLGYLVWSKVDFSGQQVFSHEDLVSLTELSTKDIRTAMGRMVIDTPMVEFIQGKYDFSETYIHIAGWFGRSLYKERIAGPSTPKPVRGFSGWASA